MIRGGSEIQGGVSIREEGVGEGSITGSYPKK